MANLRIITTSIIDTRKIRIKFTENLDSTIGIENITITSRSRSVPNSKAQDVYIKDDTLTIYTLPLVSNAVYELKLESTTTRPFRSINGSMLFQDGNTNAPLIIGPPDPENFYFNRLVNYLSKTPYDTFNPGLVRDYLNMIAQQLLKGYNDIRQAKSDNYLSITVTDELHARGKGPYDRLGNEGVYEIIRVGLSATETTESRSVSFTSFPTEPVTLQQITVTNERLTAGSKDTAGSFNEVKLSLLHPYVTKINNIFIQYSNGQSIIYDIDSYGYQIKNSRYDDRASTYLLLENNQVRLTEKALSAGVLVPKAGDYVTISYEYKNLGRNIDTESIQVQELKRAIREVCPPLITVFSLENAPIVTVGKVTPSTGGVTFADPMAIPPFSTTHLAFQKELSFDSSRLPAFKGEYSIDYNTGTVYVYGIDNGENLGTGKFPPVCTYYYLKEYNNGLDYTYDATLRELAARSIRDLSTTSSYITFDYSDDLIPGEDYEPKIHSEELAERIENRLVGLGALQTVNIPITNVFRIFNETSGEIYTLNRFNDSTVYFNYKNPPTVFKRNKERVRFQQVSNELLFKSEDYLNTLGLTIFVVPLENSNIISSTEDAIASSINTSLYFSNNTVFKYEYYYDKNKTYVLNTDKLNTIGQYVVDYSNGLIYVVVSANQSDDIGAVSYKTKYIETDFPHIISVDGVYTQPGNDFNKVMYKYNTFTDNHVDLMEYLNSDNVYYSTNPDIPFIVLNNSFQLPENSLAIRGIYEAEEIRTKLTPLNFGEGATLTGGTMVTLSPIDLVTTGIQVGNTVTIGEILGNIDIEISTVIYIKRASDGYELYNTALGDGSISGAVITLPTDTLGISGNAVNIKVKLILADNATVVVDYNRGNLYIDYVYLNDEIIVSYEHGDNQLDFRESTTVEEGEVYYASYKYGALRDGLYQNFASIIDIEPFKNFNVDTDRERYRDAIIACFQTFPKGPTIDSISSIARIISHVEPDIIESFMQEWILGQGYLYRVAPETTGPLALVAGKFDHAVNITDPTDTIKLPFSSTIKLEQGTLEFFVNPEWHGIDNDATLTFLLQKNGINLSAEQIWIGSSAFHPTLALDGSFTVSRFDTLSPVGVPSTIATEKGIFIYYNNIDKIWNVLGKDLPADGYYYTGNITTSGEFYNVQAITGQIEANDILRSTSQKVYFKFNLDTFELGDGYDGYTYDGYVKDGYSVINLPYTFDGITFMSDEEHYLFDFGESNTENRFSIYKDGHGYLNFKIYSKKDKLSRTHSYRVSKDISDWKSGEQHFIATSWRINSKDKQDEMHLFVDGFEVPNIIRYGGRPKASTTDRFRTVVPEILTLPVPNNTLANNDMIITTGSDVVISGSSDFPIEGIGVGDKVYIENPVILHPINGYFTILQIITGRSIQLDYTFTSNVNDVVFSINKWTTPVTTNIMYEDNLAVSIISGSSETEIPGLRADVPAYAVEVSTDGQPSLVVRDKAKAGDRIAIRTLGLGHRRARDRKYVWGTMSNVIRTQLAPPISLDHVEVYAVSKTKYSLSPTTSTVVVYGGGSGFLSTNIVPNTQPSNGGSGRFLSVAISNSSNVNFDTPVLIDIIGTTYSGATNEVVTFSATGIQTTIEKFKTITSIDALAKVYDVSKSSLTFEIKETNRITDCLDGYSDGYFDGYCPIIRYSQQEFVINDLVGSGNELSSATSTFFSTDIGKAVLITSPAFAAGTYTIVDIVDINTLQIFPALSGPFSSGHAEIYNISISRSGFANGMFTFEIAGEAGLPYYLNSGYYDFDYSAYLEIPFEIKSDYFYIGSDIHGNKQANALIDEMRSLTTQSTDTRTGETLQGTRSITTDYTSVNAYTPTNTTTLLMHFDEKPLIDSSLHYICCTDEYLQADESVNAIFSDSLYINEKPLKIDNKGILFNNEGTIEFWVSPKFDTANDPVRRVLFDTAGSYIEEVTSLTKRDILLQNIATEIISVVLTNGDTTNYASGGKLANNRKLFTLGRELPNQNTPVIVTYVPSGLNGDRISIYKSPEGNCNFEIYANNILHVLSTPVYWSRNSWHRIMVTWKTNSGTTQDEMRLFIDGQEKIKVLLGSGLTFSSLLTFGSLTNYISSPIVKTNIRMIDKFNTLYLGGNALGGELCNCRFDNLKISRNKKEPVIIFGQQIDNDYNSNISAALPVVEDLYTTYLLDFDSMVEKVEDYALLKNRITGIYDFEMTVIDSFDIIEDTKRAKDFLESLVNALKPAVSRAFIKYVK